MLCSDLGGSSVAVQHTGQLCSDRPGDVDVRGLSSCISVHAWLACAVTDDPDLPAGTHRNETKSFLFHKITISCSLVWTGLHMTQWSCPSLYRPYLIFSLYSVWMHFTIHSPYAPISPLLVSGTWSHPRLPTSPGVHPAQPSSPATFRILPSARARTPPASPAQQWSDSYTERFQART